jgi:hypothetical protein
MESVLFLIVIAGGAGFFFYIYNQLEVSRLQKLGAVACSVCGAEGVSERGGGSYSCGACGYDTDAEQTPERARLLKDIQEIAIALSCMESADSEFHESRFRSTRRSDGKTDSVGPYDDRYLEGMEQAEEASRILQRQMDDRPALGTVVGSLADIPTIPEERKSFNAHVTEARACLQVSRSGAAKVRAELVAAFRA